MGFYIRCKFDNQFIILTRLFNKFLENMKTLILFIPITFLLILGCSNDKSSAELFDDAEKLAAEGNIPEAALQFETLIKDYPNDKLAPETTARLAAIYQNNK